MISNIEYLQKAINSIILVGNTNGEDIAVDHIAQKTGLSMEQLQSYLNGDENIPEGLASELLSNNGITIQNIQWTDLVSLDIPLDDEDEEEY